MPDHQSGHAPTQVIDPEIEAKRAFLTTARAALRTMREDVLTTETVQDSSEDAPLFFGRIDYPAGATCTTLVGLPGLQSAHRPRTARPRRRRHPDTRGAGRDPTARPATFAQVGEIVAAEPRGLHRLYVALTRAVSALGVVHTEPLPEALDQPAG